MKTVLFILFGLSLLGAVVFYTTQKLNSKTIPFVVLFLSGVALGHFIPLSESNITLLEKIITNLAPAGFFLLGLSYDIRQLFNSAIGCACTIGAKRYYLLITLSIIISFGMQILAYMFTSKYNIILSTLFAFGLGEVYFLLVKKTPQGAKEIATTMLFLLGGIGGIYFSETLLG